MPIEPLRSIAQQFGVFNRISWDLEFLPEQKVISDYPKPMALIGGRPFLEYLILQLKKYNLTEIVLCIGYLGEKIKEYFKDGDRWGIKIKYLFVKYINPPIY